MRASGDYLFVSRVLDYGGSKTNTINGIRLQRYRVTDENSRTKHVPSIFGYVLALNLILHFIKSLKPPT